MKAETVRSVLVAFAEAQEALEEALYDVVGPCHATTMLLRFVRHPVGRGRAAHAEAVERQLPDSTVSSAWGRSGAGSLKAFQRHILLYELRRILDVPEVSFSHAALTIGGSSPQAVSRAVRLATGAPASALHRTTSVAHLAAWTALLTKHRKALRSIRFPVRARAARRADTIRMLLHRRDLLRRELEQVDARLGAMGTPRRRSPPRKRLTLMRAAA